MDKLKNSVLKISSRLIPTFVGNGFVMLCLSNKETLEQQFIGSIT